MFLNLLVGIFGQENDNSFLSTTQPINSLLNINFHIRLVTLMLILFLYYLQMTPKQKYTNKKMCQKICMKCELLSLFPVIAIQLNKLRNRK